MMNNNIQEIILSVLEENASYCMDNEQERVALSGKLAKTLITESLEQLASLLNGNLEYDNDGQAIVYTGLQNPDYDRHAMKHINPFDMVEETLNRR
jgi:hypothetical protein